MVQFPTFQGSWPWLWIGSYFIPSCITRRRLPAYQISLKSNKHFVDGRMDGHLRPTLLGWLGGVDLKSKKLRNFVIIGSCWSWGPKLWLPQITTTLGAQWWQHRTPPSDSAAAAAGRIRHLRLNAGITSNTQKHTAAVRDDDLGRTVRSNQQLSRPRHSAESTSCCEQVAAPAHHVEIPANHVQVRHLSHAQWFNDHSTRESGLRGCSLNFLHPLVPNLYIYQSDPITNRQQSLPSTAPFIWWHRQYDIPHANTKSAERAVVLRTGTVCQKQSTPPMIRDRSKITQTY